MLFQEDVQEDWGWKLVHGEVFRTPRMPMLLAVMVGNGAQLCAMCSVTLGTSSNSLAFRDVHILLSGQFLHCWASSPHLTAVRSQQ